MMCYYLNVLFQGKELNWQEVTDTLSKTYTSVIKDSKKKLRSKTPAVQNVESHFAELSYELWTVAEFAKVSVWSNIKCANYIL